MVIPEQAIEQMREATDRLRGQAWKVAAPRLSPDDDPLSEIETTEPEN